MQHCRGLDPLGDSERANISEFGSGEHVQIAEGSIRSGILKELADQPEGKRIGIAEGSIRSGILKEAGDVN